MTNEEAGQAAARLVTNKDFVNLMAYLVNEAVQGVLSADPFDMPLVQEAHIHYNVLTGVVETVNYLAKEHNNGRQR